MKEDVLRDLATGRNSDKEPEDDLILLDGDDFVIESSDGDVLDEPIPSTCEFFMKTDWKVFVYYLIPLFNMASYVGVKDVTRHHHQR